MTGSKTRVMVVEDEVLIGLDLAETLHGHGWAVDGPHRTVDTALAALAACKPDAALLDVDLGRDMTSEAVAARLKADGVPFALLSGMATPGLELPETLRDALQLIKPVMPDEVITCIRSLI